MISTISPFLAFHHSIMNIRCNGVGIHDIVADIRNDGLGAQDTMMGVRNNSMGVHNIMVNPRNSQVCIGCKFSLKVEVQSAMVAQN